jgi:hypothetical protein
MAGPLQKTVSSLADTKAVLQATWQQVAHVIPASVSLASLTWAAGVFASYPDDVRYAFPCGVFPPTLAVTLSTLPAFVMGVGIFRRSISTLACINCSVMSFSAATHYDSLMASLDNNPAVAVATD